MTKKLQHMKANGSHLQRVEDDLIRRRQEELKTAQDIRSMFERKMERVTTLYMELSNVMTQLEARERELTA